MFSSSTKFINLNSAVVIDGEVSLVSNDNSYTVRFTKGKIFDEDSQLCYLFSDGKWDVSPYSKRNTTMKLSAVEEMVHKLNSACFTTEMAQVLFPVMGEVRALSKLEPLTPGQPRDKLEKRVDLL